MQAMHCKGVGGWGDIRRLCGGAARLSCKGALQGGTGRALTSNPFLQEVEAGLILVGPDQSHTEGMAGCLLQNPALI